VRLEHLKRLNVNVAVSDQRQFSVAGSQYRFSMASSVLRTRDQH
jgi:hypothetical protein